MTYEDLNDNEQAMVRFMVAKALARGVKINNNVCNVAKARCKFGLDITICPCHKQDKDRGCISAKCYREIQETGRCSCGCFERQVAMGEKEYRLLHKKDGSYVLQLKIEKYVVDYSNNKMKPKVCWIDVETKEEK